MGDLCCFFVWSFTCFWLGLYFGFMGGIVDALRRETDALRRETDALRSPAEQDEQD